jgi:hypothetical protein
MAAVSLLCLPAFAQGRLIDDIRVTARGGLALITIEFGCEMRFVADTPTAGGALLEVRVAPFDTCRQLGLDADAGGQTFVPVGAEAAHLSAVEISSLGPGESVVMLSFDRAVEYRISQRPTLRSVEILVDTGELDSSSAVPDSTRRPLTPRVVEPTVTRDYMINLQSTRESVGPDVIDKVVPAAGQQLYVSQIRIDGVLWNRLRLGFFASEAEAEAALATLAPSFPRAWIGRAEPAEIELAAQSAVRVGSREIATLTADQLEADSNAAAPAAPALDAEEIESMMAEARSKMLAGDNAAAITLYQQLAQVPGEHRAEAIEFLGLAYERSGRPGPARNEYERYLREFQEGPNRSRVEQRLSALDAQQAVPRTNLREAETVAGAEWDFAAGLSQYYRRDDNQFDQDQEALTTQLALLTDADFSLSRRGERFNLTGRLSMGHYRDLLSPEEGRHGDQLRASYAYVDLDQNDQQWDLRVGRQSLHTLGVLGRFDGVHFSYGLGADKRIHLTHGFPVDSTADSVETNREFTGVGIDFIDLVGSWDLSAFVNSHTIDGVEARLGIGTELRYFDERRTMTTMVDYDIDFNELNMLLMLGTWRLQNRITLSLLLDQRKSPILTTRNALIGQPVETIREMLLVWTEDEVRELARDRTAESKTMTLGLATPLGERFQLNFDMTTAEIDGTVASGGVAAIAGTGPQHYYSLSLVSTGLFATSDVNIFNYRKGDASTFETQVWSWDARFPVGRHLRINPRLRYVFWKGLSDGRRRETIAPALRFLLNMRNRYRLEFEFGRDVTTRINSSTRRDATASYLNIGYRASF